MLKFFRTYKRMLMFCGPLVLSSLRLLDAVLCLYLLVYICIAAFIVTMLLCFVFKLRL